MTREAPAAIEDRKKEIGITGTTMRAEFVWVRRNNEPSELWRIVEVLRGDG